MVQRRRQRTGRTRQQQQGLWEEGAERTRSSRALCLLGWAGAAGRRPQLVQLRLRQGRPQASAG